MYFLILFDYIVITIEFNNKKEKVIKNESFNSISQTIIAEFMLLTGYVTSLFMQKNKLSAPFRYLKKPSLDSLPKTCDSVLQSNLILAYYNRANVGTELKAHEPIGMASYCQATSPIRRIADLIVHYSLRAHIKNENQPFDVDQIQFFSQRFSYLQYCILIIFFIICYIIIIDIIIEYIFIFLKFDIFLLL